MSESTVTTASDRYHAAVETMIAEERRQILQKAVMSGCKLFGMTDDEIQAVYSEK